MDANAAIFTLFLSTSVAARRYCWLLLLLRSAAQHAGQLRLTHFQSLPAGPGHCSTLRSTPSRTPSRCLLTGNCLRPLLAMPPTAGASWARLLQAPAASPTSTSQATAALETTPLPPAAPVRAPEAPLAPAAPTPTVMVALALVTPTSAAALAKSTMSCPSCGLAPVDLAAVCNLTEWRSPEPVEQGNEMILHLLLSMSKQCHVTILDRQETAALACRQCHHTDYTCVCAMAKWHRASSLMQGCTSLQAVLFPLRDHLHVNTTRELTQTKNGAVL